MIDVGDMPLDEGLARQADQMKEHGWVAHHVYGDPARPGLTNSHTHGLAQNFGHMDLQIVIALEPDLLHWVLGRVVNRIKGGDRFAPGDVSDAILSAEHRVKFVEAAESGSPVLRIILPDPQGDLDPATMERGYARQYEGTGITVRTPKQRAEERKRRRR